MQLYDYRCRNCGENFNTFQPRGARDFATCPLCHCVAEKRISLCNFTFGWTLSDESRWVDGAKDEFVRNV